MCHNKLVMYGIAGEKGVQNAVPDKWNKETLSRWDYNDEGVLIRRADDEGETEGV